MFSFRKRNPARHAPPPAPRAGHGPEGAERATFAAGCFGARRLRCRDGRGLALCVTKLPAWIARRAGRERALRLLAEARRFRLAKPGQGLGPCGSGRRAWRSVWLASWTGSDRRAVGHYLGELLAYVGGVEPHRDDRGRAQQPRILDHPVDRVPPAVLQQLGVLGHLALAHRLQSCAHRPEGAHAAHDQAEGEAKIPLDPHAVQLQRSGDREPGRCGRCRLRHAIMVGTPAAAPPDSAWTTEAAHRTDHRLRRMQGRRRPHYDGP